MKVTRLCERIGSIGWRVDVPDIPCSSVSLLLVGVRNMHVISASKANAHTCTRLRQGLHQECIRSQHLVAAASMAQVDWPRTVRHRLRHRITIVAYHVCFRPS